MLPPEPKEVEMKRYLRNLKFMMTFALLMAVAVPFYLLNALFTIRPPQIFSPQNFFTRLKSFLEAKRRERTLLTLDKVRKRFQSNEKIVNTGDVHNMSGDENQPGG